MLVFNHCSSILLVIKYYSLKGCAWPTFGTALRKKTANSNSDTSLSES